MVTSCLYRYSPFAFWIWCQMTSLTIITLVHVYILKYAQLFIYMKINDYVCFLVKLLIDKF